MKNYTIFRLLSLLLITFSIYICCLAVSAAETPVTGDMLKQMAESRKLSANPDADRILNTAHIEQNPDLSLNAANAEPKTIGDYIDPDKAFCMYLRPAQGLTRYFREGAGSAESFAEAFELFKNSEYCDMEYWQPVEPFYDANGELMNARCVQAQYDMGRLNNVTLGTATYFWVEDKYYDLAAEAVNKSGISRIDAVYTFGSEIALDTDKGSFVMPCETVKDGCAEYAGYGERSLEGGALYTALEYDSFYSLMSQYAAVASELFENRVREAIGGTMISQAEMETTAQRPPEDSDSFSKYIGTEPRYSDITKAQAAVTNQLSDLGVITGEDGMFYPDKTVTRAEIAAMLCRLFDIEPAEASGFSDVPSGHWAAGYIGALAQNGVISGLGNGAFGPDETVTCEQAAKMIENLLGYTDHAALTYGGYPQGNVVIAAMLGLTDDLGNFDSGDPLSRIGAACMLSRALDTHILTESYYFASSSLGFGSTAMADATLAQYRDGAELKGVYHTGEAAREAYDKAAAEELDEKCGDIFREYRAITGSGPASGKPGFGIRNISAPSKSNPVGRIIYEN